MVEILKQRNNNPNIIELQIILVAFGTLGILDLFEMKEIKHLISLASLMVNFLFSHPSTEVLVHFFRYLNAKQLNKIVINLLKFVFTKTNKINLKKG